MTFLATVPVELHRGAGADLVRHLARQPLPVLQVAAEGAVLDDDLAAEHRKARPGGEVAALPRRVIRLMHLGGADDVPLSRIEQHDIGDGADREPALAWIK